MGACDTWNVEINILVYENEMFSLPAEFDFNNFDLLEKDLGMIYPPYFIYDFSRKILLNSLFSLFLNDFQLLKIVTDLKRQFLSCNKSIFSLFLKDFQLLKIVTDLRVRR